MTSVSTTTTVESKTNFLRAVRDGYAEAVSRPLHAGRTVVVALHDLSLAARFCHRIVLMQAGRAVAAGAPEDVLTREHLAAVYGIEARYVLVEGVPVVLPLEVLP